MIPFECMYPMGSALLVAVVTLDDPICGTP